jgi:hypothetical protein
MAIRDIFFAPNSTKVQSAIKKHALSAIASAEGRRQLLYVLADEHAALDLREQIERLRTELVTAVNEATAYARRANLEGAEAELMQTLRSRGDAVISEMSMKLNAHLDRLIQTEARTMVLQAVAEFVEHNPINDPGMGNRAIARANGISIREVKRRRRRGTLTL